MRAALCLAAWLALGACGFTARPAGGAAGDDDDGGGGALADRDHDGVADATDNCPDLGNADQADRDGDGVGDACDNCPAIANPAKVTLGFAAPIQRDHDGDGMGDECDPCPHLAGAATDPDGDGDGIADACDPQRDKKNARPYFNGFYDPPDAAWAVAAGGGARSDWAVVQAADHALGWQQTVVDGSHRHQLVLAGAHADVAIDAVLTVGQIAPADTTSPLRGAEVAYGFTAANTTYFSCGITRDTSRASNNTVLALNELQTDTIVGNVQRTDTWPTALDNSRIHLAGASAAHGANTDLSCTGSTGGAPIQLSSGAGGPPDGQIGLHTYGVSAWFDYVFVVDLVR
ncbi:MAG TPA: thrombospondin type 3 repeat-containing protein [Kofleriaceae bacterium]|nr:thrombospondin type 3 repeat-containing protein [Kofleriaceae bacterium]